MLHIEDEQSQAEQSFGDRSQQNMDMDIGLLDLMHENGDALEDLGDSLPGVDLPDDPCCCAAEHNEDTNTVQSGDLDLGGLSTEDGTVAERRSIWKEQLNLVITWTFYVSELPFSIARCLSIPCVDQGWGWRRRIFSTIAWPGGFFAILLGFLDWDDISLEAWIVVMSLGFSIGFLFYLSTEDGSTDFYKVLDSDAPDLEQELAPDKGVSKKEPEDVLVNKSSPMLVKKLDKPGRSWWFWPILLLAFFSSIAWMNVIAGESVNAALSIATVSTLSPAIIGLTLVAWGNSVGDLVADTAVAKSGAVFTAISSTIGSPMLSAVLGMFLSITIACASTGDILHAKIPVQLDAVVWVSYGYLVAAQAMILGAALYYDFRLPFGFAKALWLLYTAFLITVIVVEVKTSDTIQT